MREVGYPALSTVSGKVTAMLSQWENQWSALYTPEASVRTVQVCPDKHGTKFKLWPKFQAKGTRSYCFCEKHCNVICTPGDTLKNILSPPKLGETAEGPQVASGLRSVKHSLCLWMVTSCGEKLLVRVPLAEDPISTRACINIEDKSYSSCYDVLLYITLLIENALNMDWTSALGPLSTTSMDESDLNTNKSQNHSFCVLQLFYICYGTSQWLISNRSKPSFFLLLVWRKLLHSRNPRCQFIGLYWPNLFTLQNWQ